MSSVNSFGRLPAPPDARDLRFRMRGAMPQVNAVLGKPTPRKRPYKDGALLDQGQKPHCVAYSGKGFMLAAPLMRDEGFDTTVVYHRCQQLDEWPGENYDGTSVRALMKAMTELGYIGSYVWGQSLDDAIAWMNGGYGTTIVGTNWYAEMSDVDANGFMREPPGSLATPIGGHAWRVIWFDVKKQGFLMRNSWGHDFGGLVRGGQGVRSGYAFVRKEFMGRLLREDGEIGAPVQIKVKPQLLAA